MPARHPRDPRPVSPAEIPGPGQAPGTTRSTSATSSRSIRSTRTTFAVTPAIENFDGVDNQTDNRHGIVGYLNDKSVAERILTGLGT